MSNFLSHNGIFRHQILANPSLVVSETAPKVNQDVSQRFGLRLKKLRAAKQMTQSVMARKFGIDRSFISDIERGRKGVSLGTLDVLALGLGMTISELLEDV